MGIEEHHVYGLRKAKIKIMSKDDVPKSIYITDDLVPQPCYT